MSISYPTVLKPTIMVKENNGGICYLELHGCSQIQGDAVFGVLLRNTSDMYKMISSAVMLGTQKEHGLLAALGMKAVVVTREKRFMFFYFILKTDGDE